jgi:uncharacterized protein YbgA (DUF1722 family)/uncharacterized protein YbbK (DUF523 family)
MGHAGEKRGHDAESADSEPVHGLQGLQQGGGIVTADGRQPGKLLVASEAAQDVCRSGAEPYRFASEKATETQSHKNILLEELRIGYNRLYQKILKNRPFATRGYAMTAEPDKLPIPIGVSACLLGEKVRYDGGHKHDRYITDTLGKFFTFVPVCPEVECGMPIPREAMRLEGDPLAPRLMTRQSRIDKTDQMTRFCMRKVKELEDAELCGFIFKKDSPSSGLLRVKVYHDGMVSKSGSGLFAAAVARHFPLLPLEEEGRLCDPAIRENFIERVFSRHRWQNFLKAGPDLGGLVEFHTSQKLLMMAHSPVIYREMGSLVAGGKSLAQGELFARYEALFMKGLTQHATVSKNTNVLQHIMGYFKKELSSGEKAELLEVIRRYHDQMLPLIVPLTLVKHYVAKYDQAYLQKQVYLEPHPAELMLRNHV